MFLAKGFVICVCFVVYFKVTNATTYPTTAPTASTPPKGISQSRTTPFENKSRSAQYDPIELRLTQLMAVQVDGKSERVKSFVKDLIHEEVTHILKGFEYDKFDLLKQIISAKSENTMSSGKDTLLILLDNLAKQTTNLRSSVDSLKSDVEFVKSNNCSSVASRVIYNELDSKLQGKRTSVGVGYSPRNEAIEASRAHEKLLPRDCDEVQKRGNNQSGVYKIQPGTSKKPFMVLCDMETRGGGWAHIQKRVDGSQDFYLDWRDYKFGFGDLEGEFWLGLENIYSLVGFEVNELLVEIVDRDNKEAYAHYKGFGIGPEADGYPLNVLRGFSGDAGDSLVQHFGSKFSTKDFDQDENDGHCAQMFLGGWWYKSCHVSNLNGKYLNAVLPKQYKFQGVHWLTYKGHEYCHAKARMMVRPARLV